MQKGIKTSLAIAVKTDVLSLREKNLKVFFDFVFFIISNPRSFAIVVAVEAEPPLPNTKIVLPLDLAFSKIFSKFKSSFSSILLKIFFNLLK